MLNQLSSEHQVPTESVFTEIRSTISDEVLETAVAQLARAALTDNAGLSLRIIRRALETELACNLTARRDLIVRTIEAALDNALVSEEPLDRNFNEAVSDPTTGKRRRLSSMQVAAEASASEHASCDAGAFCNRDVQLFESAGSEGVYQTTGSDTCPSDKRKNSGQRPFACDECNYQCADRNSLTVHKRVHSGERPYSCDQCQYRCSTNTNLKKHKRVHSRERSFACNECDYRCSRSNYLAVHMRTHSNERPFACDKCDFRCSRSNYLIVHARSVHSGKRPFACDKCHYRCAHRSNLTLHKRRVHSDKR